jgi:hypothetical protein
VTLTKRIAACLLGAASTLGWFTPVIAAEGGHGAYLLGLKGPGAGIAPPPGIYFSNNLYYYNASATANRLIPTVGGEAIANVKAKVWLSLPSILWSTPVEILGGRLMVSALIPVGGPSVDAGATVSSRFVNPVLTPARNDSVSSYGDPVVSAQLGWKAGHFHWTAGVSTFLPIGDYKEGALANVANHRLAADVNGALTWLDPNIGLDLSVAAGVTFNKQNESTKYRTGNEFHVEWAAVQNLTKEFSIGAVGYYYRQFSGDGGPGATLGAFKGEVAAVGGTIGYTFKAGQLPISTRLRVYREFDVRNRVQGTAAFFTVSMPLYVHQAAVAR